MMHVCITNQLDDFRSCTIRGEHRTDKGGCDGYQHQYSPVARRDVVLDVECTGCLPQRAELGYLCYSHLAKLGDALRKVPSFIGTLWEIRANGVSAQPSNDRVSSSSAGSRWTLVESRTQAAWIVAAMRNATRVLEGDDHDLTFFDGRSIPVQANIAEARLIASTYARILDVERDRLVSTKRGAEAVVRFIDLLQRAMRRFPTNERASRIAGIRCEECQHADLIWRPPLAHLADVVITCRNCGAEYPQTWLEQWSDLMQIRTDDDPSEAL